MAAHTPPGYPLQDYYSRIYKTYDLVNRVFTLGQDRKWRSRAVRICLLDSPRNILDLCCGTGDLALEIARSGPEHLKIMGYDMNDRMLEVARDKAKRMQIDRVEFLQGDAASMPFADQAFDRITIGFGFRNLTWGNPDRDKYLREISRILQPGGRLLILESAVPDKSFVRFFYRLYLRLILIPLGGLLSGNWKAYRYLAGSSSGYYDFETLRIMLVQYNLILEPCEKYLLGSVNLLIATKKGT